MRNAALVASIVLVALATPAVSDELLEGEFTCPLCRKPNLDLFSGVWQFEPGPWGIGLGPELQNWTFIAPGYNWVKGCPHCGYCNTVRGFHVVAAATAGRLTNPLLEKKRPDSPFFEDKPAADEAHDADQAGQADQEEQPEQDRQEDPQFLRLHAARPMNYPAIRKRVAQVVGAKRFRYLGPYCAERIDILLKTIPDLGPRQRLALALAGVWWCDDQGEATAGVAFRRIAISDGPKVMAGLPPETSLEARLGMRYQLAEMQMHVGYWGPDADLRREGRQAMAKLREEIPLLARQADKRVALLRERIAGLWKEVRTRKKELGRSDQPDPIRTDERKAGEWGWTVEGDWRSEKDASLRKLYGQIDRLRKGDAEDTSPAVDVDDMPLYALRDALPEADLLRSRIDRKLAADTMRDLPLDQALTAAKKGTVVDREGFLVVDGHWRGRPKVRAYLRELLGPLWEPWWQAREADRLYDPEDDPAPDPPPAEAVLCQRYLSALAQVSDPKRADAMAECVALEVLGRVMSYDRGFFDDDDNEKDKLPVVGPDKIAEIAAALQATKDIAVPKHLVRYFCFTDVHFPPPSIFSDRIDDGPNADLPERLCAMDTAWSAKLLLDDLPRRPRWYLANHVSWWPGSSLSGYPVVRTPATRLIARHLPGPARKRADQALQRLADGKTTALQAAVSLLPLAHMADAESLATLRRAAAAKQEPVRLLAARCLLDRGERLGMEVLLAESAKRGQAAILVDAKWRLAVGELIALLTKADLPKLQALWRTTREKHERAKQAYETAVKAQRARIARGEILSEDFDEGPSAPQFRRNNYWVLAACARLGDKKALREYHAWLLRVDDQVGEKNRWAMWDTVHTPLSARAANARRALWDAAAVYCTEAAARELMKHTNSQPHWSYYHVDTSLLEALAGNARLHDMYRTVATNLADRPTPRKVKSVLLRYAKKIPTPAVDRAITRWTRSAEPWLRREALAVRERLGPEDK